MEKHALLRMLMKANPVLIRKLLVGRPPITLFKNMSPAIKLKLMAGRKLLESESGAYRKVIELGLREGMKDKALIGATLGAGLGAGSLGWSLAKENPETESRLAKLLAELLFLPEDGKGDSSPTVERQEPSPIPEQSMNLSDLYSSNLINWGEE